MRGVPIDNEWSGSMPEIYERFLVPALFAPYAEHLAQRAAAEAPATVLEVAAGTGAPTRALVAALPGARVTATDLNPAMVSWSAQRLPEADWQVADARDLPVPDASVDLVACQFGVMFVPDKIAAFTEAAGALAPQGALLCTTWGRVETSPFPEALVAALAEVLPVDPPDFVARIPHGYADPAQVATGFCQGTPLRFALEARGGSERDQSRATSPDSSSPADQSASDNHPGLTYDIAADRARRQSLIRLCASLPAARNRSIVAPSQHIRSPAHPPASVMERPLVACRPSRGRATQPEPSRR